MTKTLQPMLHEFAAAPRGAWAPAAASRRIGPDILRSEGFAGHPHAYALFEEMEDKDPHLSSLLQTRKLGVLSRRRKIEAGGETGADKQAAAWTRRALDRLPGWNAALAHMLDCLAKGMAVVEVLWGTDAEGRLAPVALKPRAAERFALDEAGQWRLVDPHELPHQGKFLPPRKFIFVISGEGDWRPYGKGLCERIYWYWWFKKHNQKFWLIYNEKFGSPTVVAKHSAGLGEAERERLLNVIESIQNEAGVTVPEGITLELLEASRSGGGDTYRDLAQWCNDEMARAILGQTLTSSEGERAGSLALAKVHETVRLEYQRVDAWMLMDAVNHQLVRWMTELNFDTETNLPRWMIDLEAELDLAAESQVDNQLLSMGVPLSRRYFYSKYGRPEPAPGESRLQYDDSNLYQYHLQYGVLTVNEVRTRLGLAPVVWGDKPASPVDSSNRSPSSPESTGEDQRGGAETRDGDRTREK